MRPIRSTFLPAGNVKIGWPEVADDRSDLVAASVRDVSRFGRGDLAGGWRRWLLVRVRGMKNPHFPRLAARQTLPIAQSTIGKLNRVGFRMGTPNGTPSHAPESLSHSCVNSSTVADAMSADWRHAAPRFSFIASWLVPFAPPAPSLSPPRWLHNASAPSPPRPAARLTAARNKRRGEASDQR
jgi:hypothetical protein